MHDGHYQDHQGSSMPLSKKIKGYKISFKACLNSYFYKVIHCSRLRTFLFHLKTDFITTNMISTEINFRRLRALHIISRYTKHIPASCAQIYPTEIHAEWEIDAHYALSINAASWKSMVALSIAKKMDPRRDTGNDDTSVETRFFRTFLRVWVELSVFKNSTRSSMVNRNTPQYIQASNM